MDNNGKFVFYESVLKSAQNIEKFYGTETAYHFLIAVIEFGCYGLLPAENDPVWAQGFDAVAASIDAAASRYAKAQRDGARGGRARKQVSIEDILELQAQHLTQKEIAAQLNVAPRTIQRRLQEYRESTEDEQRQNTVNIMADKYDKTDTVVLADECDTTCRRQKNGDLLRQNTTVILADECDILDGSDEIVASMRQNTTVDMADECDKKIMENLTPPDAKTGQRFMADECDKIRFNYGGLMRQNAKRRQNLTITNTITKTKKLKADENVALMRQNDTVVLTQNMTQNDVVKKLLEGPRLTEEELDYLVKETDLEFTVFNNVAVAGDKEWEIVEAVKEG